MRSIERRFTKYKKERPNLSTLMNFAGAVTNQYFSADQISRKFTSLVDRGDYSPTDRPLILKHLLKLSCPDKYSEEHGIRHENRFYEAQNQNIVKC